MVRFENKRGVIKMDRSEVEISGNRRKQVRTSGGGRKYVKMSGNA